MATALHVEMSLPYIAFAPPPAAPPIAITTGRASPPPFSPSALSADDPPGAGRRTMVEFVLPEKEKDTDNDSGPQAAPSLAAAARATGKGLSWRQKKEIQDKLDEDRLPDDPYVMYTPVPPPGPEIFMAEATENLGNRYVCACVCARVA